jgi:S-disulfanyl-L-cysteine oxidoreductase SoxD
MTVRAVAMLVAGAAAMSWSYSAAVAFQATPRTVWDGVYTEAQAKRVANFYKDKCSKCHAEELTGNADSPPLTGAEFTAAWNELSINDLFDRIIKSMPDDDKGSLTRPQVADLIAFILSHNEMPAGKTELPTEAPALRAIKFLQTKP